MEDLNSLEIEQAHVISSFNKTLGSLEESPPSTKKLSQVKYPKEIFKKIEGAMKRKIFNLRHCSDSDSSGEGEMIAQRTNLTKQKKRKKSLKFLQFFKRAGQLGIYPTRVQTVQ
jgi:hypothetical protein